MNIEDLEWLKRAQKIAHMGLWDQDPIKNTLWWSDETYRIFGLAPQSEVMNFERFLQIVRSEDQEIIRETTRLALLSDDYPYKVEYQIILPGNHIRYLKEEALIDRNQAGVPVRIVGIIRDVTKEKKAEDQIKTNLKEKEILLQELHHRVKNNLAVISSLLRMQANSMDNEQLKSALMEGQNRVQSIASIHETLYQSEDLSAINLDQYIKKLAKTVVQSHTIDCAVNLKIEVEDIILSTKQASPLGLIVNELITNSFKYAFPARQSGEIQISLFKKDQLELIYKDNGIGIPESFDWYNANSMGLSLVRMLTENQLEGVIKLERCHGTKFTIRFNVDKI